MIDDGLKMGVRSKVIRSRIPPAEEMMGSDDAGTHPREGVGIPVQILAQNKYLADMIDRLVVHNDDIFS